MKKFSLIFVAFVTIFSAQIHAKISVVVSVLPQKFFVEKIGGELVSVSLMVPKGKSPETYEPLPNQMKAIKKARVYFTIGMPFESKWQRRFLGTNPLLKIIDVTYGMEKIAFVNDEHSHDGHSHGTHDPHVWNSIALSKIHAKNIAAELSKIDEKNAHIYKENLEKFLGEIEVLDAKIREILSNKKHQIFVNYHPAWGYFAREFGLKELSIEEGGKDTKSAAYKRIIDTIKREKLTTIFIQPEFSKKRVEALADSLNLKIVELKALPEIWDIDMLENARKIAEN